MSGYLRIYPSAAPPDPPANPENTLTIAELDGVTTSNYPVQIGRPFAEGEIAAYPQALIDGAPVTTQADVKTRWADGSVKHAILSFLIPSLGANSTKTVTFQNQATGNNTGYLDEAGMLGAPYDFDATMALTNGTTETASARTMLDAGHFAYWLQGSVCTSVILADHSASRTYDLGFDAYQPFRPIFHATFWPTINKVRVRFIGELANTEEFENVSASIALTTGAASPASVYTKATTTQHAGSRWTRGHYWVGAVPSDIAINHNLAYLVSTGLLPNYDTTIDGPSAGTLTSAYASWTGASTDLYESGNWQKGMATGGDRPDLGPYPTWTARWLYSWDNRMLAQALGNADLAAAFPVHLREGNTSKYFDAAETVPALGKVLSLKARPSICFGQGNGNIAIYGSGVNEAGDRIALVGTYEDDGWHPETAHQPAICYPQYLLTGDFWYLEEMRFWASWSAGYNVGNGAAWGRGPTGAEGGLPDEVRAQGKAFRHRCEVAVAEPDDAPEKAYWEGLIDDAIAQWEGVHNITGTAFEDNAMWTWGRETRAPNALANAAGNAVSGLGFWDSGLTARAAQENSDPTKVYAATAVFEQDILIAGLGRGKELGFATDALLDWAGRILVSMLTTSGFNGHWIGCYVLPVIRLSDHAYFPTWLDIEAANRAQPWTGDTGTWTAETYFDSGPGHGYAEMARWALSYCTGLTNGTTAWATLLSMMAGWTDDQSQNPRYILSPRS